MEDTSVPVISYVGNLERVSQDKRAGTLTSCSILILYRSF